MCGISGILTLDGSLAEEQDLKRMNHVLSHRGPDGHDIHIDGELGLGHTRLAILDLTNAGKQPMCDNTGRYWITYNGEIYNFIELRKELEALGYSFRSESDTEVILTSYIAWGKDCVSLFNGMWAFAIWDSKERELFICRDRFGIKPLYYYLDNKIFAFSSEIKGFLGIKSIDLNFDPNGLATTFAMPIVIEGMEQTAWRGCNRLLPGHQLEIRSGKSTPNIKRWWNTLDHLPDVSPIPQKQNERLKELLFESVRLRLRSDVQIGTCLSGGVDSSSIFGMLNQVGQSTPSIERQTDEWQSAYVVRFLGSDNKEQDMAEDFVRQNHANLHVLEIQHEKAISRIAEIIYSFEEVGFLYPGQWLLYQAVRHSGTTVSMDGHGADECLAGYAINNIYRGRDLTNRLIEIQNAMLQTGKSKGWSRLVNKGIIPKVKEKSYLPYFDPFYVTYEGQDTQFLHGTPQPYLSPIFEEDAKRILEMDLSFQLLYNQGHTGFMQWILRKYDLASMAHGVEVRTPFLDWRFFCYCLALPTTSKIGYGYRKLALRRAMKGIVPSNILKNRHKTGFNTPVVGWLKKPLHPIINDCICNQDFLTSINWDGYGVAKLIKFGDYESTWPYIKLYLLDKKFQETRKNLFNLI